MGKILYPIKIGDKFRTNASGICKVIKITNSKQVYIKFIKTGAIITTQSINLRKGNVKDPLLPTHQNIGFLGIGKFALPKNKKEFQLWCNMLKRCYDSSGKWKSYSDCYVVTRWHNFQKFAEDIQKFKNWNTPGYELDKDLIVLGNRKYGPKTCSFVPRPINAMFNGNNKNRHSYYGVQYVPNTRSNKKFYINMHINGKTKIKYFMYAKDAYKAYLHYKITYLQIMANKFKNVLHKEVYNNLMSLTTKDLHIYITNRRKL